MGLAERRARGFVLIAVAAGLALVAIVTAQLALRVDGMREQSRSVKSLVAGRAMASQAFDITLHWILTHPSGPAWFGSPESRLMVDGRPYRLPDGTIVAVQDQRGLLSLNLVDDELLGRLLTRWGASATQRDALLDILKDYADTDKLRRLNGAEASDYLQRGLGSPADDWLLSAGELARMPVWRDMPGLIAHLQGLVSVRRSANLNPNVMPMALLREALPLATAEELTLFDTLRRAGGFSDAAAVQRATGLNFARDVFVFHASRELSVVVWAPGMVRALEYQVTLSSRENLPPWLVNEIRLVPLPFDPSTDARFEPFPSAAGQAGRP